MLFEHCIFSRKSGEINLFMFIFSYSYVFKRSDWPSSCCWLFIELRQREINKTDANISFALRCSHAVVVASKHHKSIHINRMSKRQSMIKQLNENERIQMFRDSHSHWTLLINNFRMHETNSRNLLLRSSVQQTTRRWAFYAGKHEVFLRSHLAQMPWFDYTESASRCFVTQSNEMLELFVAHTSANTCAIKKQ